MTEPNWNDLTELHCSECGQLVLYYPGLPNTGHPPTDTTIAIAMDLRRALADHDCPAQTKGVVTNVRRHQDVIEEWQGDREDEDDFGDEFYEGEDD